MSANPVGFERWNPGEPWGDVVHADGTRTSVFDPDGSIEADARQYGARYNAAPPPPPAAAPEPALSGAASPPLPPSTPSAPASPPLPTSAPLTQAEKAPLQPPAQDLAAISAGLSAPATPSTQQSPTAQALADHGVDPSKLTRAAPAPGGAPAPAAAPGSLPGAGISPALDAVKQHAPGLVAASGKAGYEGPDAETRGAVQSASDQALLTRNRAIDEGMVAKGLGVQAEAGAANEAYFAGFAKQQQALGSMAALQKAQEDASARLNTVKQTPIKDHPDFPEWFTVSSILGSIAGGFAEGFSGGRYHSTTLPMIQQIIGDWKENQKYNKSQLVDSLTAQLGDRTAALNAAEARLKEGIADMAEAKARFARTPGAMKELKATADSLRAQSLDDWGKTQTTVMGKASESISLEPPKPGPGYTNETLERLKGIGIDQKSWDAGLGEVVTKDGPTIVQAAQATKQIDADIAELQSIMAQNGGTLPTKGAIRIPQALVPTLSRLGYKPGMDAEATNVIISKYLTAKAKSYGASITKSDRENAEQDLGSSGPAFMKGLTGMRDSNNRAIMGALEKKFAGRGQQALNILLERTSEGTTPGIPNPPSTPFEAQNVENTGPKEQQFPETADEKQMREEQQKRQESRKELLAQPEIKKQQEERDRLPIGQRFSPF